MKRQYLHSEWPSVTQVLDCLRKPGLEIWFKNNTPDFIKNESEKGKMIGTTIHEFIQNHIEDEDATLETDYLDEVKNGIKSFFLFKKENPEVKLKKAEICLTSEKYKYNGTLDAIAKIDNELVVFDWKSGTIKDKERPPIYDDSIYQISAYVIGYNEMMKADIKKAYIVAIAKDKIAYNKLLILYPAIESAFHEVFLSALKIFNYQDENKEVKNNGYTRQGNSNNTKRSKRYCQPSDKLPDNF